jgi:hypothetical protein
VEFLQLTFEEENKNAQRLRCHGIRGVRRWIAVCQADMQKVFLIAQLMSLNPKPCMAMYFSKKLMYYNGFILSFMSKVRFEQILRYCDNFFTSPAVARLLWQKKTHLVGTIRQNRNQWPKNLVSKEEEYQKEATGLIFSSIVMC